MKKVMQLVDVLIGCVKGIKGRPQKNHLDGRNAADYSDELEDDDFDDELEEMMGLVSRRPTRSLNYEFAHRQFATLISHEPNMIFAMSDTDMHKFIVDHLEQILEYDDFNETFRPVDVKVEKLAIEKYPAFLVTFPTPRSAPDAFMVCAVKRSHADGRGFWYFTLERMDANSRTQKTAFCELQEGKHLLIESSDSVTSSSDFVRLVGRRIQSML